MSDLRPPWILVQDFTPESAKEFIEQVNNFESTYSRAQPLVVQIESYGGYATAMANMLERLERLENPVFTYTTGVAMSCGIFLLTFGNQNGGTRIAHPQSMLMLHELLSGIISSIPDMEDHLENAKRYNSYWMRRLANVLGMERSEEVRSFIKDNAEGSDLYLSVTKAKKLNIIDQVGTIGLEKGIAYEVVEQ